MIAVIDTHLVNILRDRPKIAALDEVTSESINSVPEPIQLEFIRWFARLQIDSSQFKPLQQILLSAVFSESVSGVYPAESIPLSAFSMNMESESSEVRQQSMLKYYMTLFNNSTFMSFLSGISLSGNFSALTTMDEFFEVHLI